MLASTAEQMATFGRNGQVTVVGWVKRLAEHESIKIGWGRVVTRFHLQPTKRKKGKKAELGWASRVSAPTL